MKSSSGGFDGGAMAFSKYGGLWVCSIGEKEMTAWRSGYEIFVGWFVLIYPHRCLGRNI